MEDVVLRPRNSLSTGANGRAPLARQGFDLANDGGPNWKSLHVAGLKDCVHGGKKSVQVEQGIVGRA
jgi:hypothetical protein